MHPRLHARLVMTGSWLAPTMQPANEINQVRQIGEGGDLKRLEQDCSTIQNENCDSHFLATTVQRLDIFPITQLHPGIQGHDFFRSVIIDCVY